MKLVLYSIGCPKCTTLAKKLEKEHFNFVINSDMSEVIEKGFQAAPVLKVIDEENNISEYFDFNKSIAWINKNKKN